MFIGGEGRRHRLSLPPLSLRDIFFKKKKSMENKGKYRKLSLKESNMKPDSNQNTLYYL